MLTVKFQDTNLGCVSIDGYPLHLIDVVHSLNASAACGNNQQMQIVTQVWVDNRAATIAAANSAGYTIYNENDCTQCATAGYYGDHDPNNPGVNPVIIYLWNFKGNCRWEGIIQCGPTEIEIVFGTKKTDVCNDIGVSTFLWIDDLTFTNATGVFENSGLGQIDITVEQNICNPELGCSVMHWFKEKGVSNGPIKRLDGNQNLFIETSTCTSDPGIAARYEHRVFYNSSQSQICREESTINVWTDAEQWGNSTTMWTTETGQSRPSNGYYKPDIVILSDEGAPYYSFSSPDYFLNTANPTGECANEGGLGPNP